VSPDQYEHRGDNMTEHPPHVEPDGFTRIHAAATSLQADLDADPDLQADPAIAGEIEGLWQALRLLDEPRWRVLYQAPQVGA
jgi:hypothetical protein